MYLNYCTVLEIPTHAPTHLNVDGASFIVNVHSSSLTLFPFTSSLSSPVVPPEIRLERHAYAHSPLLIPHSEFEQFLADPLLYRIHPLLFLADIVAA